MEEGKVSFTWKDYADGCRRRVMKLDAVEFLRRFLIHFLPRGFVRIRQFGFLSNRCRRKKLDLCRRLLAVDESKGVDESAGGEAVHPCPACKCGTMVRTMDFEPGQVPAIMQSPRPHFRDTS